MRSFNEYKNFNSIVYLIFMLLLSMPAISQTIYGPTTVEVGEEVSYSASSGVSQWYLPAAATIIQENPNDIVIRWEEKGNYGISAEFEFGGGYLYLPVTVTDSVRNPIIASKGCSKVVLRRDGSPPQGSRWYWQGKSSNGTRIDLGYGETYEVTSTGNYYIRERKSNGSWSPGSGRIYIPSQLLPGLPSKPIASNKTICGNNPAILTASGVNGAVYKWYGADSQYLKSGGSYTTPNLTKTVKYYVTATVNGCESNKKELTVTVNETPPITTSDGTNYCSSEAVLTAISSGIAPDDPYIEHKWYTSQNGSGVVSSTKYDGAASYITQVKVYSGNVDYWVSAVYKGCESERKKVTATFNPVSQPELYAQGSAALICGDEHQLYFYASGGGNGSIYEWYNNNNVLLHTGSTYQTTINYKDSRLGTLVYTVKGKLKGFQNCSSSTINQQKTITIELQKSQEPDKIWYIDTDNDGFGDIYGETQYSCTDPDDTPNDKPNDSWVDNNDDLCPDLPGTKANKGCPADQIPENWNTVTTRVYDATETLKGASKAYFDALGKSVQTQTLDLKTGKTWASQTLYDTQGRPALNTLPAPIGSPASFEYKAGFMQNAGNTDFSSSDFETNPETPATVGTQENTLGWYYSNANTSENYQDITNRPYSRTIYSTLNPGTVLKTIGGNKVDTDRNGKIEETVDKWPQSHTFSMLVSQELSAAVAFGEAKYNNYKVTKTIVRDVHGEENVLFTDSDGKTLAAARSGGAVSRVMQLSVGAQGYVDIHVPAGSNMGFTVNTAGNAITTYDLITELPVTPSTSLPNGFYRVAVNNPDTYAVNTPVRVTYKENYYDYSLNEYDTAGRLTTTYQPLGDIKNTKQRTDYQYNTLGQLVYTKSPDEGEAWFKYRKDGQIRFSQNSKQKLVNEVSYTNYDQLARPEESGVFSYPNFLSTALNPDTTVPSGTKKEQNFTTYDALPNTELNTLPVNYRTPRFLAGNVAKTSNSETTTYYSYDIYGRVVWVVQNINGLGFKTIDYEYHPITGQVTRVEYQKNTPSERFGHKYSYHPQDNSLVKVETATNGTNYTLHAEYRYYETGSLKRTELAGGLQGIDYVYNLTGQLKAINPGGESNDLFSMQLDYHSNDYKRVLGNISAATYGKDQFNGNIKGIRWQNKAIPGSQEAVYAYTYDRNNWLTGANFNPGETPNNGPPPTLNLTGPVSGDHVASQSITITDATINANALLYIQGSTAGEYDLSNITYDANGNIKTLVRNKNNSGSGIAMDNLTYTYKTDKPNQLLRVNDSAGDVSGADDIGNQNGNNYVYNSIGQLVRNNSENIDYLYNTGGLVTEVKKDANTLVKFFYNDKGFRVKKESYTNGGTIAFTEHYVRDASGTVMAIYRNGQAQEYAVYGKGRHGVYKRADGTTQYELTDHLGNVRAVFKNGNAGSIAATDYYPFGMPMPGRNMVGDYRYGYQGQEKDTETGKEAFQLRLWDSRIGRWLSPDPYRQFDSPYLGMGNNPVRFIDPDGGRCQDAEGNTIPCDGIFGGEDYVGPTNETLTALDEVVVVWSKENNSIADSYSWGLPFGTEIGTAGAAASIGKSFVYNNDFWLGKNGKFYNQTFNGNQYTGGKNKFAKNLGKNVGRAGTVLGAYSVFATERAYANGEIGQGQRNVDQTVNGIGFFGPYGAAFNLGFNSGYLIEDACNCNIQLNPNTFKKDYWENRSLSIHNLFSDTYVQEESIFLK